MYFQTTERDHGVPAFMSHNSFSHVAIPSQEGCVVKLKYRGISLGQRHKTKNNDTARSALWSASHSYSSAAVCNGRPTPPPGSEQSVTASTPSFRPASIRARGAGIPLAKESRSIEAFGSGVVCPVGWRVRLRALCG